MRAAHAQVPSELFSIFGGVLQSAIAQNARAEWQTLPQSEIACIERGLRVKGLTLRAVIAQGMGPAHPRLNEFRRACDLSVVSISEPGIYIVANTRPPDAFLSLRSDPSSSIGRRLNKLPNGTRLEVMQKRADGWWLVRVLQTQEVGWAMSGGSGIQWIVCCEGVASSAPSAVPPTPTPPATSAVSDTRDPPTTDCDTYAAHPLDAARKSTGVVFEKINVGLAYPACSQAASQYPNSARIQYQLGRVFHRQGNGQAAMAAYQHSAALGSAIGLTGVGALYANGTGVQRDFLKAVEIFRKAADMGAVPAYSNLGHMYANGNGVPRDTIEAFRWYLKSAELGDPFGQTYVGLAYSKGVGVAQNTDQAITWLQRAVAQGHEAARQPLTELEAAKKQMADAEELRRKLAIQAEELKRKQAEEAEEIKRCERLAGAKSYFVASCVVKGVERGRRDGLDAARLELDQSAKNLACGRAALDNLQEKSGRLATKILSSGAISPLMDFSSAIAVECRKAADSNLEKAD